MSQSRLEESVWAELFELQDESAPGLVQGLVDEFCRSMPQSIEKMKSAVEKRDGAALSLEAHKLKSSCAYLGASGLRELCIRIEKVVDPGNLSEEAALVAQLESDYVLVKKQMAERIAARAQK